MDEAQPNLANCIISTLFFGRTQAHRLHLNTRSLAQHLALGELYELLNEYADDIGELLVGETGDIEQVGPPFGMPETGLELVNNLITWVTSVPRDQVSLAVGTHLDDLAVQLGGVAYKLRRLS